MITLSKVVTIQVLLCCFLGTRCSQLTTASPCCKVMISNPLAPGIQENPDPAYQLILIRLNG